MKIFLLFLAALPAFGQINLRTQVRGVLPPTNGGTGTVPANTLPATCTPGQIIFKLNATPGLNSYGCTAAPGTWTLQSGSGGGGAGVAPYSTTTITASPMSIPNSTHGQGVHALGTCWSSAALGQEELFGQEAMGCLWSRDPATGNLTLTYTTTPARVDITGGGGVTAGGLWGTIIGNIAEQVDLVTTFAPKASPIFTGQVTIPNFNFAGHSHQNTAGGGALAAAAIASGILSPLVGGTGNGFLGIAGPASTLKTWTIPNASINFTALTGVGIWTVGVPGVVTGTATDCVLVNGTSGPCGSGSGGGSVFTGSTAVIPASSGTMTFDLADLPGPKSPKGFEPTVLTANVTAVTILNKTPGAEFSIDWTQSPTTPYTVTYGSVSRTCPISATLGSVTTQFFKVGADGTTVKGNGCIYDGEGIFIPGSTPPGGMTLLAPDTGGGNVRGPTGNTVLAGVDVANTAGAAMTLNMSAATGASALRVPVKASVSTAVNGAIGYDSTTDMLHAAQGSADAYIPQATITPVNDDCVKWVVAGGKYKLGSAGAACGSGGGGGTAAVTYTFTSQTTVTINAAATSVNVTPTTAHGMGTLAIPKCFDSATPRVAMLCYYTRDTSGNLVFTFAPAQSGQIQVGADGGGSGSSRASITTAGLGFNAPWGGTYISAVSLAANVVVYQQFVQPFGETVATIGIYLGGIAASKSIAYGIYDSACNLISGATGRFTGAAGAGIQTITLATPAALTDVGVYHLGIATEDAAATIGSTGGSTLIGAFNLGTDKRFFTGLNPATGTAGTYALPSACGAKTVSTNPILFGVLLP